MAYTFFNTLKDIPEISLPAQNLIESIRPRFLRNFSKDNPKWIHLQIQYPEFQLVVHEYNKIIAVINTVPAFWVTDLDVFPYIGWDWVVEHQKESQQNCKHAVCMLAISINPEIQGKGFSSVLMKEIFSWCIQSDYYELLVPVRPLLKSRYPLTHVENYLLWKRQDGSPFDPWIRLHWSLGAQTLCVSQSSINIQGTIAEWENWTGMSFPESGKYIVPDAIEIAEMDISHNLGIYVEPCIWMRYQISRK